MKTKNAQAAAAATSVAAQRWPHLLNQTIDTVLAPHLARPETRATARQVISALLSPLTRKNCWTLAEHAGHPSPYRTQHLLARASLDENALTAALRGYVIEQLGTHDVVLVVDETGDIKQGISTVGVARQYTGTTGQVENCQVAVYLAYTTTVGHALVDHRLYLPLSWTDDVARLHKAGVPDTAGFATKPELAGQMIDAALEHVPHAWVAGDEVYGRWPRCGWPGPGGRPRPYGWRVVAAHRGISSVLACLSSFPGLRASITPGTKQSTLACLIQLRMVCDEGSNSAARSSGLRPERASAMT
ncbi:IS701 family transposase [Nocardiopsis sp. JB363]|uniref:IS701 family transposase n=1 Tax=Nocardiopsis sp. JB363 TaxID=1434837 RepID=UPI001F26337C|nr:IS701 family transposase [Nocardiopsis sp. JB363]